MEDSGGLQSNTGDSKYDTEDDSHLLPCAQRLQLFLTISGYFEYFFRFLVTRRELKGRQLPDCLVLSTLGHLGSFPVALDQRTSEGTPASRLAMKHLLLLKIVSMYYFSARFSLYFLEVFGAQTSQLSSVRTTFEDTLHNDIKLLYQELFANRTTPAEHAAIKRLLDGLLDHASVLYHTFDEWKTQHHPSAFSAITLDQLAGLACRQHILVSRYGEHNVEKVFETQLSLVIQSLGLYVVPAGIGEDTIDLICISGDPIERFSFLVDAKTSKAPYSLPKKDSRAIRDYVTGVRSSLSTFPPLSFVLIVGHPGGRTLARKTRELEAECGVPVRFLDAAFLADLREQLPGVLPLKAFRSQVIGSSSVIAKDFVRSLVDTYSLEQQAHQLFVKTMLSVRGMTQPNKRKSAAP